MISDTFYDSKIERLYLECTTCFENADVYMEGGGEVISNGVTKLKAFIQSIIDKVKDFFSKFRNNKEAKVDPTVEVDEKEVSKVKKFLAAVKKVITIPYNKLEQFFGEHKKASTLITFVLAFSVGALVLKKSKDPNSLRNLKADVRHYEKIDKSLKADIDDFRESKEKCNKAIRDLENTMGEYESTIKDLNKAIEKVPNITEFEKMRDKLDKVTKDRDDLKKTIDVTKEGMKLARRYDWEREWTYDVNHKNMNDAKKKYARALKQKQDKHPHIYSFYTTLAKKISQVISAIQQALLKLKH